MNWGNAAIGKINSVLHGLEADIKAGASTITDPQFLEDGRVTEVLAGARQFSVLRRVLVAEAGAADGRQKEEGQAQEGDLRQGRIQGPVWPLRSRHGFKAPPAGYGDYAFILHILASLTDDGRAGIVCPQGVLFRGQPEVEEETGEFDEDGNPKIKRRKADDEHLIRKALLESPG